MSNVNRMKLSDRLRPDVEAAPWVIEEVKKLEEELADAYLEMRKQLPKVVFDREVWARARHAARLEVSDE